MTDVTITVETPKDSSIIAYGTASNPRRGIFLMIGAAVVALFLGGLALVLAFGATFEIPSDTALLISLTPKEANRLLSPTLHDSLPATWKAALQGTSWWPVVLGSSHTENGWYTFALLPRWRADKNLTQESRGFMTLLKEASSSTEPNAKSTRHYTLTDVWRLWRSELTAQAVLWLDPTLLLPNQTQEADTLSPFTAALRGKRITTSIKFQTVPANTSLKKADLSLSIPPIPEATELNELLLSALPTTQRLSSLAQTKPSQISLNLVDRQSEPLETVFAYPNPLSLEQAQSILADFGLFKKRVIQLPDGTLATEQTALSDDSKALFGQKIAISHGFLQLEPTELSFGKEIEHLTDITAACPSLIAHARLSGLAEKRLLANFHVILPEGTTIPPIQLGAYKGSLTACFE